MRKFVARYANWNPITVEIEDKKLKNATGEEIVRHVVGTAFKDNLKGYWDDAPDRKVVVDKDNPGVWVGRRIRDVSKDKKDEPFYVMEL